MTSHSLLDVFSSVIKKLNQASIDYMVVGSVASVIYGEPRMTRDMDLVVEVSSSRIPTLSGSFPPPAYYCPPHEVLTQEVIHRGQFNIMHLDSGLKIDFMIRKNDKHSIIEFSRRKKMPFTKNFDVYVAAPEDVIIKKLLYYREGKSEKHLLDIRGILANCDIDKKYLQEWVIALGISDEWAEV